MPSQQTRPFRVGHAQAASCDADPCRPCRLRRSVIEARPRHLVRVHVAEARGKDGVADVDELGHARVRDDPHLLPPERRCNRRRTRCNGKRCDTTDRGATHNVPPSRVSSMARRRASGAKARRCDSSAIRPIVERTMHILQRTDSFSGMQHAAHTRHGATCDMQRTTHGTHRAACACMHSAAPSASSRGSPTA